MTSSSFATRALSLLAVACTLVWLAACSSHPHVVEVIPLNRPQAPAEFVSDTVVIPPELQDKVAAIFAGTSGIDWDTVDTRTLELDWRRARVYSKFEPYYSGKRVGNQFWRTNSIMAMDSYTWLLPD